VFVQYLSDKSYKLFDSNYTIPSSSALTLTSINPLNILDDIWLNKINMIIKSKYGNLLGTRPSILSIAARAPYYRIGYQASNTSY
jgi:hypothetical protein